MLPKSNKIVIFMLKVKQLIRILESDGWVCISTKGSHMKFTHQDKTGIIIVPFHAHKTLGKGFVITTLKKAGLK
jgi:predicted RNA binding protein YcfA (HicA-like mRNA interferase family)